MLTTFNQDRLIDLAAHYFIHAEAREEGDVAIFTDYGWPLRPPCNRAICEIGIVNSADELRAMLGY